MRVFSALLLVVTASGCSVPELDAQKFACVTNADCGPGWVCNPQSTRNFCVEADRNVNGVFDDRLVLGVLADLSDTAIGQLGRAGLAGYQAFVKRVNTSGGVHGRRIELVAKSSPYLDARTRPEAAGDLLAELLGGEDRQAFALAGVVGTDPSLLAKSFATENQVLFFGPASGADVLEQDPPNRYLFNVRGRYSQEAAQLTRMFLGGSLESLAAVDPEDVAVFAQGSLTSTGPDDFGKSGVDGVKRAVGDAGGQADKVEVATYGFTMESGVPRPVVDGAAAKLLRWMAADARDGDRGGGDSIPVAIVLVALAVESFQTDVGIGTVLKFSPDNHQATDKLWGIELEPDLTPRPLGLVSDLGS